jgi:hypothetical protein
MTSKNLYLKTFGSIFLLAGLAFLLLNKGNVVDNKTVISKKEILENTSTQVNKTPLIYALENLQEDIPEEELENPFEGKEVKYRFQQVAAQFAEDIKYPIFSMPIRGENELRKYLPNRSISSSTPINLNDANAQPLEGGPRISLKTSKFRYYKGEEILAKADITGLEIGSSISVSALVMVDKKVIARASKVTRSESTTDQNGLQYNIRFNDLSNIASGILGDMTVVAEFNIDGQLYGISSLVRYPNTVATLDHVGTAEVQEEYLQIPMYINTSAPGLHAISGNLYDAESGTPLAHLNAIEELTSASGVILLKAHIVTLKKMGYEGPYELKDVSLSRGPSAPKYVLEQGLVEVASFSISGFPFSEYEDIPYVDERAQARLNFLTQLGSTD